MSRFRLIYEGRSGRPYSFTFDNDANGDRISDNDLLFVPAHPDDVVWESEEDRADWIGLLEQNEFLRDAQGRVFPRNGARSPFVHQWDFSFTQDIPIRGTHRLQFTMDILNLGQLLNDEWGHVEQVGFEYVAEVVNYRGIAPDGRYIYSVSNESESDFIRTRDLESSWQVQFGLRYEF